MKLVNVVIIAAPAGKKMPSPTRGVDTEFRKFETDLIGHLMSLNFSKEKTIKTKKGKDDVYVDGRGNKIVLNYEDTWKTTKFYKPLILRITVNDGKDVFNPVLNTHLEDFAESGDYAVIADIMNYGLQKELKRVLSTMFERNLLKQASRRISRF